MKRHARLLKRRMIVLPYRTNKGGDHSIQSAWPELLEPVRLESQSTCSAVRFTRLPSCPGGGGQLA
jgi:hypothetical protein